MNEVALCLHQLAVEDTGQFLGNAFPLCINQIQIYNTTVSKQQHLPVTGFASLISHHQTVHGSINSMITSLQSQSPVGARFSAPLKTGPGAHPASYIRVSNLFSGGKAAGAWR